MKCILDSLQSLQMICHFFEMYVLGDANVSTFVAQEFCHVECCICVDIEYPLTEIVKINAVIF